jgi:hypothetical protein
VFLKHKPYGLESGERLWKSSIGKAFEKRLSNGSALLTAVLKEVGMEK